MEVHIAVINDESKRLDAKSMNLLHTGSVVPNCCVFVTSIDEETIAVS